MLADFSTGSSVEGSRFSWLWDIVARLHSSFRASLCPVLIKGASGLNGEQRPDGQNRQPCDFLTIGQDRVAYLTAGTGHSDPTCHTIVFLGGFRSNMRGEKAEHLSRWCAERDQAFLRLDYYGHGESSGAFADGTIGKWRDDALAVIDHVAPGPVVLIGSSMGAWISTLVALARRERIVGMVGIAAAPDFTEDLIPERLGQEELDRLWREGLLERPSAYSAEPDVLTRSLLEEARGHLVLRAPIDLDFPLRLIHGLADPDVPWEQSRKLLDAWKGADVELTLIKDGDHRLSRDADLQRMTGVIAGLLGRICVSVAE